MMLYLVALAGMAAVSEGFAVVSPARWPLGSRFSPAFAAADADAAHVNTAGGAGRRPGGEAAASTRMMSQATGVGAEARTSSQEPVFDQESWALVRNLGCPTGRVQFGCVQYPSEQCPMRVCLSLSCSSPHLGVRKRGAC